MEKDIARILIPKEEIAKRVRELGAVITADYQGRTPVLVGILKGSVIFMSDLARAIDLPCSFEFMQVSSYGSGSKTTGAVKILLDLNCDIAGQDVIIVEDILDSGLTLSYLLAQLRTRSPASLKICTLLDKPARHRVDIPVDYLGFTVEDAFLVGYGLDYAGRYRNLPYVGELSRAVYESP